MPGHEHLSALTLIGAGIQFQALHGSASSPMSTAGRGQKRCGKHIRFGNDGSLELGAGSRHTPRRLQRPPAHVFKQFQMVIRTSSSVKPTASWCRHTAAPIRDALRRSDVVLRRERTSRLG